MNTPVFLQRVGVEVGLDRRLRCGDALIVEVRDAIRDGELFVAESDGGACIGRYAAPPRELVMYSLENAGGPLHLQREALRVRGVVIGVKSAF